ncbi:hypothetical protein DAI22_06g182500 [Oryza sativa Japonica Group]|jgi:hypothetical protein|nr:hypothetical protein DAI22_06g182500 [Oryza sativa Japonica Group]
MTTWALMIGDTVSRRRITITTKSTFIALWRGQLYRHMAASEGRDQLLYFKGFRYNKSLPYNLFRWCSHFKNHINVF